MYVEQSARVVECAFLAVGCIFLLGSVDDLFIDIIHLMGDFKVPVICTNTWRRWARLPEKSVAIMIPAWREHSVLESMVSTNRHRLKYENYRFYVGVYPNDAETLHVARDLEARFPHLLTLVVTDRPGPTSKAHCLNCILRVIQQKVDAAELVGNRSAIPDFVAIHDAEDLIHPKALTAVNAQPAGTDFIQLPIFSLPVPAGSWVAGTYLDEFAEIHLKEIPVRESLGMTVPSAGVGTFFAWAFMKKMGERFGYWFDEDNLTEDYEMSLRMARLGARQKFLLIRDDDGEIVSTREYFPDSVVRSVRQKTRWTTGISLQTWRKWSWMGASFWILRDWGAAYGLWRDRKALWSNPVSAMGWILALGVSAEAFAHPGLSAHFSDFGLLKQLFLANTLLFVLRFCQRARFCAAVYGNFHGLLSVPRLALSTCINAAASLLALRNFALVSFAKSSAPLKWDKTEHKFPVFEIMNRKEPLT